MAEEKDNKTSKAKKLNKTQELQEQLAESKDQYIRLAAEFDNFRRRSAKERLDLISTAGKDILTGFLPVLDDCQRALDVLRKSEAQPEAIEGTELILNKLTSFLNQKGIERINAIGEDFNTDFHEAVAQIPAPDDTQKNKVIDVVQEGYTLNGTVVRFAKVVVGV